MGLENATAKDYKLIIYNKVEVDGYRAIEEARVNDELSKKSDKVDEGSPSGIATLDPVGKHNLNEIPIASQSESEDITVVDKVMTPERVNQHLLANGYMKTADADTSYGNLRSDGSVKMDAIFNPQNTKDIATVEYVQNAISSNTNTYVLDTLAEMLAIDPLIVGDVCFVANDGVNNGEYLALVAAAGGSVISDWQKRTASVGWGSILGDMTTQTDLENRFTTLESDVSTNILDINANSTDIAATTTQLGLQGTRVTMLEAPVSTKYTPQATAPVYAEGQVSYSSVTGSLEVQGKHMDVTLQVGREQHVEVYNNTGAIIPNGSPIRYAGISLGIPSVVLALADTFDTASSLGVATHDIQVASTGLVTTFGQVGDIDLSAFAPGDIVYLSDTVAGGMTTTAPDIATRIGIVFSNDAITGKLFVNPESNIALPTALGLIKGRTINSYSLTAGVPLLLQDYSSELNVVTLTNFAAGTIGVIRRGIYEMTFSFSGTISDEEINITWELWDVTNGVVEETFKTTSGRAADPTLVPIAESFSIPVNVLTDSTVYVMRVTSSTTETLVLDQTAFTMKSLHIR